MKKSRIAVQFILGLFLLALIAAGGCGSSDNAPIPGFYTISGQVTGDVSEGVEIYLSGSASATSTTTDEDGNYSFTVINGNYTVIPVLVGYTFSPVSTAVVVNGANRTGIDFTATTAGAATTYSISGKVTGAVQAGVTITLSGAATGTASTLADGSYIFSNLPAGSYTLTPSSPPTDYTFDPASIDATIVDADIVDQDFTATVVFEQADLEGTWHLNILKSGGGLFRATVAIAEDGAVNMSECMDGEGPTTCPTDDVDLILTWTIDENGVISASITYDGDQVSNDAHYTMTLNKNFIAGTMTSDGMEYSILQKVPVDPSAVYNATDLNNKTFVLHQLDADKDSAIWAYGEGFIDNEGNVYLKSYFRSDGTILISDEGLPAGQTLAFDPDTGIITIDSLENYQGFLSEDKKTGVGTVYDESHQLIIFQFTGDCDDSGVPTTSGNFTAGPISAGTYSSHLLGIENDVSSGFWVHSLFTVDNLGKSIFDPIYWETSNDLVTAPIGDDYISLMGPTGTVKTSLSDSYHGQMSADGMFIVRTQTNTYTDDEDTAHTFYSLGIDIRRNAFVLER